MSRPARKVTKREIDICFKHRVGKFDKKTAMEKLGVSSTHVFHSIFYQAAMAAN